MIAGSRRRVFSASESEAVWHILNPFTYCLVQEALIAITYLVKNVARLVRSLLVGKDGLIVQGPESESGDGIDSRRKRFVYCRWHFWKHTITQDWYSPPFNLARIRQAITPGARTFALAKPWPFVSNVMVRNFRRCSLGEVDVEEVQVQTRLYYTSDNGDRVDVALREIPNTGLISGRKSTQQAEHTGRSSWGYTVHDRPPMRQDSAS